MLKISNLIDVTRCVICISNNVESLDQEELQKFCQRSYTWLKDKLENEHFDVENYLQHAIICILNIITD